MQPASPLRAETRRIIALAWPVALTSFHWTLLQLTDVVVVGMTGTDAAAAFGASRTITFVAIMIGLGCLTGVLVQVSRADGAGDLPRTGRVLHHGLLLALGLGAATGALLYGFAMPMLAAVGVAREVAPEAAGVVRVMGIAFPFQLLSICTSFYLEGISRPRRVMAVNLAILPVNALLAWAWSGGHLGFPEAQAVGAAAATAVASVLGTLAMFAAAWTSPGAAARGVRDWRTGFGRGALAGAGALLGFGIVPGLASGLELAGFSILIALSTQLGEAVTHAFQIVFSIHNIAFGIALGLGSAAGVRVGNAVGEGRPEAAASRTLIATALAVSVTGALALLVILARAPLVAAFPASGDVHALALAMLTLWAPFMLFDAAQIVFVYALRSLGDQVVAGINSALAFFVVTGGAGLALVHAGAGPQGLVIASAAGMLAAALLHGARLWQVSCRVRPRS